MFCGKDMPSNALTSTSSSPVTRDPTPRAGAPLASTPSTTFWADGAGSSRATTITCTVTPDDTSAAANSTSWSVTLTTCG